MSAKELSKEKKEFNKKCREIYNSGRIEEAYQMPKEAYLKNPDDLFYKYKFGVMSGDYSFSQFLGKEKQIEFEQIAKKLIKEVIEDSNLEDYPEDFVYGLKNEYYFFNQLFEEHYKHGQARVAKNLLNGYYSMCVGANELARISFTNNYLSTANDWAKESLRCFYEYEKVNPDWYNINHFAALSLIVLGKKEEAILIFKEMYRKQKQPVNEEEFQEFLEEVKGLEIIK